MGGVVLRRGGSAEGGRGVFLEGGRREEGREEGGRRGSLRGWPCWVVLGVGRLQGRLLWRWRDGWGEWEVEVWDGEG